jgi:hypothetical protein
MQRTAKNPRQVRVIDEPTRECNLCDRPRRGSKQLRGTFQPKVANELPHAHPVDPAEPSAEENRVNTRRCRALGGTEPHEGVRAHVFLGSSEPRGWLSSLRPGLIAPADGEQ